MVNHHDALHLHLVGNGWDMGSTSRHPAATGLSNRSVLNGVAAALRNGPRGILAELLWIKRDPNAPLAAVHIAAAHGPHYLCLGHTCDGHRRPSRQILATDTSPRLTTAGREIHNHTGMDDTARAEPPGTHRRVRLTAD